MLKFIIRAVMPLSLLLHCVWVEAGTPVNPITVDFENGATTFPHGATGTARYLVKVNSGVVPAGYPLTMSVKSLPAWATQDTVSTSACTTTTTNCGASISLSAGEYCCLMLNLDGTQLTAGTYSLAPLVATNPATYQGQAATTTVIVLTSVPIVFMTKTTTSGDMSAGGSTGLASADALCNNDAQTFGTTAVKAHTNYKALLIASNRTPCSIQGGVNGCSGSYAIGWPLAKGTNYYNPDGTTLFNTVTTNSIFPDTNAAGTAGTYPDIRYPDNTVPGNFTNFWFGPQSVLVSALNGTPTAIVGWAYDNLTVGDTSDDYLTYFALCTPGSGVPSPGNEWTNSGNSVIGAVGQTAVTFATHGTYPVQPLWTNYFEWNGSFFNFPDDCWSLSFHNDCSAQYNIICVSAED